MKYRTRLMQLSRELSAGWAVGSMLQGEMALYYWEHDMLALEDEYWRVRTALQSITPPRKLPA